MLKFFSTLSFLLLIVASAHCKLTIKDNDDSLVDQLKGNKFQLIYQVFISSDTKSTNIDTVKAQKTDYIYFTEKNIIYMSYKEKTDSLRFKFINKDSLSMGDTPFLITNEGNGYYKLYQIEKEANGEYNSVTYLLKKEENDKLSYSK